MLELIYRLRRALNPAAAHREDVLRAIDAGREQAAVAAFARETQRIRAARAAADIEADLAFRDMSLDSRR